MRYKIEMPLAVTLPRKTMADKRMIINLNNYRNWHRMTESAVKKAYTAIAVRKLAGIVIPDGHRAVIGYRMYKATNRRIDRANVLTIHMKYAEDAMTEAKCFPDDNDDWIESQTFRSGGLDRANPRVEIEIQAVPTGEQLLF